MLGKVARALGSLVDHFGDGFYQIFANPQSQSVTQTDLVSKIKEHESTVRFELNADTVYLVTFREGEWMATCEDGSGLPSGLTVDENTVQIWLTYSQDCDFQPADRFPEEEAS